MSLYSTAIPNMKVVMAAIYQVPTTNLEPSSLHGWQKHSGNVEQLTLASRGYEHELLSLQSKNLEGL